MSALAPGPGFPNCTMLIGWCPATKTRASSSRESTAPAVSCPLASAGTEICGASEQRRAGGLPVGQVGAELGLVRGGAVRGDHPDGDEGRPGAEGRENGRRPGAGEAAAEQAQDGRRLDHHGRADRDLRGRPEHEQLARGEAVRPERRAHRRITGDLDVPADLLGHPGGGRRTGGGGLAHGGGAGRAGRRGAAEVPDSGDRQHPDDQDDGYEPGHPPGPGPARRPRGTCRGGTGGGSLAPGQGLDRGRELSRQAGA